jgi:hypothetical protein
MLADKMVIVKVILLLLTTAGWATTSTAQTTSAINVDRHLLLKNVVTMDVTSNGNDSQALNVTVYHRTVTTSLHLDTIDTTPSSSELEVTSSALDGGVALQSNSNSNAQITATTAAMWSTTAVFDQPDSTSKQHHGNKHNNHHNNKHNKKLYHDNHEKSTHHKHHKVVDDRDNSETGSRFNSLHQVSILIDDNQPALANRTSQPLGSGLDLKIQRSSMNSTNPPRLGSGLELTLEEIIYSTSVTQQPTASLNMTVHHKAKSSKTHHNNKHHSNQHNNTKSNNGHQTHHHKSSSKHHKQSTAAVKQQHKIEGKYNKPHHQHLPQGQGQSKEVIKHFQPIAGSNNTDPNKANAKQYSRGQGEREVVATSNNSSSSTQLGLPLTVPRSPPAAAGVTSITKPISIQPVAITVAVASAGVVIVSVVMTVLVRRARHKRLLHGSMMPDDSSTRRTHATSASANSTSTFSAANTSNSAGGGGNSVYDQVLCRRLVNEIVRSELARGRRRNNRAYKALADEEEEGDGLELDGGGDVIDSENLQLRNCAMQSTHQQQQDTWTSEDRTVDTEGNNNSNNGDIGRSSCSSSNYRRFREFDIGSSL